MRCPKCKEEGFDYKLYKLYPQVECKHCRYFIHINSLTEDEKKNI